MEKSELTQSLKYDTYDNILLESRNFSIDPEITLVQKELCKFLFQVIQGEKMLDAFRLAVLNTKDFDFINAFALLDS